MGNFEKSYVLKFWVQNKEYLIKPNKAQKERK